MKTLIAAGDTTYDAFFPMAREAASAASQGMLLDLNELKYLDFDNAWNRMLLDSLEIKKQTVLRRRFNLNKFVRLCSSHVFQQKSR